MLIPRFTEFTEAVFIIKSLYKLGTKRLCKALLKSQRLNVVDTDIVHEFERVLTNAGLPADVESIIDDDDNDDDQTYEVPVEETDIAPTQPLSLHHLNHYMMTTTQFIRSPCITTSSGCDIQIPAIILIFKN
jgi:hypothetical protein